MKKQILALATAMTLAFAGAALAQVGGSADQQTTGSTSTVDNTMGAPDLSNAQPAAVGRSGDQNDTMNHAETAEPMDTTTETTPLYQAPTGPTTPAPTPTTTTTTTTTETTGTTGTIGTAYSDQDTGQETLPSTASDLPSLLLIGLLALGAAFAIHAYTKRRA